MIEQNWSARYFTNKTVDFATWVHKDDKVNQVAIGVIGLLGDILLTTTIFVTLERFKVFPFVTHFKNCFKANSEIAALPFFKKIILVGAASLIAFSSGICVPVYEELLFRDGLQAFLEDKLSLLGRIKSAVAIALSSFIFGIAHWGHKIRTSNILNATTAALGGLTLGSLYKNYGLFPAIVSHGVYNLSIYFIATYVAFNHIVPAIIVVAIPVIMGYGAYWAARRSLLSIDKAKCFKLIKELETLPADRTAIKDFESRFNQNSSFVLYKLRNFMISGLKNNDRERALFYANKFYACLSPAA